VEVWATIDDPRMPLAAIPDYARRAESVGFAGLLVPEAVHDGFVTATLALQATTKLVVATSVALAFPRSPTVTAYAAWDLQSLSGGRFRLGLGSQVKGNVVARFGIEWKPPVRRMRDYVGALRALWRCWQEGSPLDYTSEHYRLSRMQPFFNPGPIEHGHIPIYIGAVNPQMIRLAGEIADGLMTHPTNTSARYLAERIRPLLEQGQRRASRERGAEVLASTFVATGPTADDVATERERIRQFLGFLYSTPQYRATLDLHGWSELGTRLHALSREGRWDELPAAIGDDVFDALVPSGTYAEIAGRIAQRYGGVVRAITLRMPDDEKADRMLADLVGRLSDIA
jgi:probable F420-dependent oxidoreductase